MTTDTDAAVLARVVGPALDGISPELARTILKMEFSKADRERIGNLSGRAQEGKLTKSERAELERYIRVGDFMTILKSKARQSVRSKGAGNGREKLKSQ